MIDKDAPIKVAVQDETRNTEKENLGEKETGKIPGENLTDHPPNNIFQSQAAKNDVIAMAVLFFVTF